MEYLHAHDIIHRDIKPENILLHANGHICLTDFGFAKILHNTTTRTICGTSEYMAPEMILYRPYGVSVDFWSLGVLAFQLLTGNLPFVAKACKDLNHRIIFDKLIMPQCATTACCVLLKGLLDRDVRKRLQTPALKQLVFFRDVDWTAVQELRVQPPQLPTQVATTEDTSALCALLAEEFAVDPTALQDDDFPGFAFGEPIQCSVQQAADWDQCFSNRSLKAQKRHKLKVKTAQLQADKRHADSSSKLHLPAVLH